MHLANTVSYRNRKKVSSVLLDNQLSYVDTEMLDFLQMYYSTLTIVRHSLDRSLFRSLNKMLSSSKRYMDEK